MKRKLGFYLALVLLASANSANANTVLIDAYSFDLNQFDGTVVTSNSTNRESRTVDQLMGIDPYSTGDLVSPTTPDILSLGNNTHQEWLKYTYGTGFYVGTGMSRLFVVYESSSSTTTPDAEGTAFEINFNGVGWVDAGNNIGLSLLNFNSPPTGTQPYQNQIVFDLTSAAFGFTVGTQINTVEIRNRMGLGTSSDPDFTFAAHAGTSGPLASVVPLPAPAAMGLVGLVLVGLARRRKPRPNAQ